MLSQAIGGLLPAAVAVALSPIPIVAIVVMLGTPRARTNGPSFAVGWVLGLAVVSTIVVVLASGSDDPSSSANTGVGWVDVALGVLLLALAAKQWRTRPRDGEEPQLPSWMATVDTFGPGKAFTMGVLLSAVNPKNLALTVAAAAAIAEAGLDGADTAIAIVVFVAIASVTVAGAVLYYLIGGQRATAPLTSLKTFMGRHNNAIMMVILLVFGAKLLGDGLAGLAD